jgi:hypothetical protein
MGRLDLYGRIMSTYKTTDGFLVGKNYLGHAMGFVSPEELNATAIIQYTPQRTSWFICNPTFLACIS